VFPSAPITSLVARDLTLAFGGHTVLDGVTLTVDSNTRVGIVGPNGTGKTTLLRILAGLLPPDRGSVRLSPAAAAVAYLPQEPDRRADETLVGFLARRTGVVAATAELDAATAALAADPEGPGADRYSVALDRWLDLGGADFEARAEQVWDELGLAARLLHQPTATLSGGQAARASLASILLSRAGILLLDEPTNDLDFDGLERLESFVERASSGIVVVSHDRAFLEGTITSVVELDEHTHRSTEYHGGWLAYLDEKETAHRHATEAYEEYRDKKNDLVTRARMQRQWAVQGVKKAQRKPRDNDKAQRDFFLNRTEKQAAKVRITEKALERLDEVEKPWEGWRLDLEIASAPRSGDVVARLTRAVVERGSFRLGPVDLEVGWADRIAVLGPNGSGKTTLLGALFGTIPLSGGERWVGPGVVVGTVDQARERLVGPESLLDAFVAETGVVPREGRSLLAKFALYRDHVERPAASLSPGERTRAVLALLMARGVNCLVLDEPTNHLDMQAIEQIEQALDTWTGTLLLVTHDRRLLDNVRIDRTVRVLDGAVATEVAP
jgi:ATPase subunit of ABC transporter with duplicated ATPase domains